MSKMQSGRPIVDQLIEDPEIKTALRELTQLGEDLVNDPPWYHGEVEAIDAIRSALGEHGFISHCRGCAMKYLFRAGRKEDRLLDLQKAEKYLRWAIETELHLRRNTPRNIHIDNGACTDRE